MTLETRCAAVALLFLGSVLSCSRRAEISHPSATMPVILISIDTLRSDHLPVYGYKGVSTPNVDALRAESILYERAYSHVPLTLPSHVSILTGLWPADNGVRDNVGFLVSPKTPMIQELLQKNGYATGAGVSSFVLRRETLLSRGFDRYDDSVVPVGGPAVMGRLQRDGADTLQSALQWLDGVDAKPFFLFLHLYEPHTPYEPPEPFFSRYADHYDGEIAYADELVGRLMAALKNRGIYDRALIILLSDHGEGLGDHGEEEHGFFLYREALQVPLLVKLPHGERGGASVATPVQLVDVFPTILERTATPMPRDGAPRRGQSLLTFLDGGPARPIYSETNYARFHFGWSDTYSLIEGDQHFIRAPQAELFDLRADPAEKTNVAARDRRARVRMQAAIEPLIRVAAAPSAVDSETSAKLAALGYVGSTVTGARGRDLPDPKSMLGTYRDIRLAFALYEDNHAPEALRLTDRLLAANDQITDLWDLKSKTLYKMRQRREALEAAKEGLRHVPGAISLLFDVSNVAMALGDLDTAAEHARIAMTIEPGRAHEILSRVALLRGDANGAEREATLAVAANADPRKSLMLLGSIAMDRKDYARALALYDRAADHERVSKGEPIPNLHLHRGDALARLGRVAEAESEMRAEVARFPNEPRAYSSLIMLLLSERRSDEATRLVFEAVNASPRPKTYVVMAETLQAIGDERGAALWAAQGLQKFPRDEELRHLPARLAAAVPVLRR